MEVNGNDLVASTDEFVSVNPNASSTGAGADGENEFGIRDHLVDPPKVGHDLMGHRTTHEEHIGMPRGSDPFHPKTLGIIIGRQDVDDLDAAAVAGAPIGVTAPEPSLERR